MEPNGACPGVSSAGTSSVSVTQTCWHENGQFYYDTGSAGASASYGEVRAWTHLASAFAYPLGESLASFSADMIGSSPKPGPLRLQFVVRLTGNVQNHPDSHAGGSSTWSFNGEEVVTWGSGYYPLWPFDEIIRWWAPRPVFSGESFTLEGVASTAASDYGGYADVTATLLYVGAVDAAGKEVPFHAEFVPEPSTGALLLLGAAAFVVAGRRRSRRKVGT
jgi:hypothetical protein